MKTATLSDITQEQFDTAVQTVISGIKSANPKLDTRVGTVLRDLLVTPDAQISALTEANIENVRKATSLKLMKESEDSGSSVDAADVDAILGNFNLTSHAGTAASGLVKIVVSDGERVYSVPSGTIFKTASGLEFSVSSLVAAATTETAANQTNVSVTITTELYKGTAGYFFLVPVTCSSVGSSGNIPQGTVLTPTSSIFAFVSSEAYKTFDGGSDTPNLTTTIAKIPSGLSIRGFVNKTACEGMLRDEFDDGNYPIIACSVAGYGSGVQRRDQHNLFGVSVGGRIDLYVRNFGDLYTVTKTVYGTKTKDGEYQLTLSPSDFPGSCWVKSVSDPFSGSSESSESVLSSLLVFSATRTAPTVATTWHDIQTWDDLTWDTGVNTSEAYNTVWQGFSVQVSDVNPDGGASDSSSSNDTWSETRPFKVTVYCLPQAAELQAFVDRSSVRSVATDVVVRCPMICNVTVSASVRYDAANPLDETETKNKIRSYINSLGFVGRLTRSEIVKILKDCGAVSVDLTNQDMLYGIFHDANGTAHELQGDALDIGGSASNSAMISADTVIFAAEAENIQIKLIPN